MPLPGSIPLDAYKSFTRHLEDREYFGQKLGLERIQSLLNRLGNPERQFKSIHIAGTNGKGSTAAMIASILKEAGIRTGLYTSPHLNDFCERIRIGRSEILPDEVLQYARRVREAERQSLTFFELATAIAFLHFASKKVFVAVIETGLGGRLDATNVIQPVLSLITTIGLDHTVHLGSTLEAIAAEKGGIIKSGVPVITGDISEECMEVIRDIASRQGSPLWPIGPEALSSGIPLGLAGGHQRRNAALAVAAIRLLRETQNFQVSESQILRGLRDASWPGRLETIQERPWILLDGAHNAQAMRAVRGFLEENLRGRRLKVLLGMMADKDMGAILQEIVPLAQGLFLTAPCLKRAARPYDIGRLLDGFQKKYTMGETVDEAMASALKSLDDNDVLLITGSLFVVGEARVFFKRTSLPS